MKDGRKLTAFAAVLSLCLTGCQASKPEEKPTEAPTAEPSEKPAEERSPAEISEAAMDAFLAKLSEESYTMKAPRYLQTNVCSRDLVWFDYDDEVYNDFAVMSVNNETFQGLLEEDGIGIVKFLGEGQAVDAASSRLPLCWLSDDLSEGNIYNLFYNQQDTPLTFVSYDENVKRSVLSFAGYSEMAMRLMEEVYLEMDDVDPKVVHLKAVVNDDMVARINYDDIDVVITFGEAADNALASEWMKDPKYPEARTAWTESDLFIMNSVFLPGYGDKAIPFPPFASYAMAMDENYMMTDAVAIRDSQATEQNLADYIDLLKQEGFTETEITAEDGTKETVYRRILREEFNCYTSISAEYDNGVNITAKKYYDFPLYDGLDEVNAELTRLGYEPLPASDNFVKVAGKDIADELTESWLYFFAYDTVLYADIDFSDREEMEKYLADYEAVLAEAGFEPIYEGDSEEVSYYKSADGFADFRYMMLDDDTVSLRFKKDKVITPEEAGTLIAVAGFPAIELYAPMTCRNLTRFEKVQYDQDFKIYLAFDQNFETMEEAEKFLNAYEEQLTAAGFERVNPANVGSRKANAIYNEEKGLLVGIDVTEQASDVLVNFDFSAE